jgi:hypothetical protein
MIKQPFSTYFDWLGISSSSICLIHCLLTPVILMLNVSDFSYHLIGYLALLMSFFAAYNISKNSKPTYILIILWLSFLGLAVSILFEDDFIFLHYLSYLSSFGLIVAHILNMRYCKKCNV